VRTAAQQEHRSIAHTMEVLIRNYCGRNGIEITDAKVPDNNEANTWKRG